MLCFRGTLVNPKVCDGCLCFQCFACMAYMSIHKSSVLWALAHCQDEQTLYSRRPRRRACVHIYLISIPNSWVFENLCKETQI